MDVWWSVTHYRMWRCGWCYSINGGIFLRVYLLRLVRGTYGMSGGHCDGVCGVIIMALVVVVQKLGIYGIVPRWLFPLGQRCYAYSVSVGMVCWAVLVVVLH